MVKTVKKTKHLRLSHRKHTGRRLHRTHTSYPVIAVLLLMVGVLLAAMTMQVRAEDVVVTATANGPLPIQKAVILSPKQDDHFTAATVPVTGTCEPNYFVKIYRNDIFAGTDLCTPDGTFAITITLFEGRNDLVARTFNSADEEGLPSKTVTVYLDKLPPLNTGPFYLTTEYFFRAAYAGQPVIWDINIVGGIGPFTAYIDWGDGYSDVIDGIGSRTFRIEHKYGSLKEKREYFSVIVRVKDVNGRDTSLQLKAIMNDSTIIGASYAEPGIPGPVQTLNLAWWAYALVVLMGVCFWLGERRGESIVKSKYRRRPA